VAPEYSARSLETGAEVSLGALRGRIVLLNVWALWCGPCRHELPALEKLRSSYRGAGLEVVGVNIDGRGQEALIRRFSLDAGIHYPIWLDPDDRVSNQFGVIALPTTFLIDQFGRVRWRGTGALDARSLELNRLIGEVVPGRS